MKLIFSSGELNVIEQNVWALSPKDATKTKTPTIDFALFIEGHHITKSGPEGGRSIFYTKAILPVKDPGIRLYKGHRLCNDCRIEQFLPE